MALVPAYIRQPRRLVTAAVVMLGSVVTVIALFRSSLTVRSSLDHLTTVSKKMFSTSASGNSEEDLAQVFEERRNVYMRVCRAWKEQTGTEVPGGARSPYIYRPANFSVCGVPKIGVTFWKRVFFFLYNRTGAKPGVASPMDVNRQFVHTHTAGQGARVHVGDAEDVQLLSAARRVMFSRDPWSRLWSAYVDKFVLPDSWLDYGVKIVKMRNSLSAQEAISLRNQSELERRLTQNENSPRAFHTVDKTKCSDDITFAEFLRYVAVLGNNAHWQPVHKVCNPCVYRPQYLGKMETFGRDAAYVLRMAGLSDKLQLHMSHSNHILDELEQLTTYHFTYFRGRKTGLAICLDNLGIARRLWRAFQLNGYISADDDFPEARLERQFLNLTNEEIESYVVKEVQRAHSHRPLSHEEWSALKRRNMAAAYRSVPKEVLYKLQEKFRLDFELFQYDRQPLDLFGE